jgi:hypothetical protein
MIITLVLLLPKLLLLFLLSLLEVVKVVVKPLQFLIKLMEPFLAMPKQYEIKRMEIAEHQMILQPQQAQQH